MKMRCDLKRAASLAVPRLYSAGSDFNLLKIKNFCAIGMWKWPRLMTTGAFLGFNWALASTLRTTHPRGAVRRSKSQGNEAWQSEAEHEERPKACLPGGEAHPARPAKGDHPQSGGEDEGHRQIRNAQAGVRRQQGWPFEWIAGKLGCGEEMGISHSCQNGSERQRPLGKSGVPSQWCWQKGGDGVLIGVENVSVQINLVKIGGCIGRSRPGHGPPHRGCGRRLEKDVTVVGSRKAKVIPDRRIVGVGNVHDEFALRVVKAHSILQGDGNISGLFL